MKKTFILFTICICLILVSCDNDTLYQTNNKSRQNETSSDNNPTKDEYINTAKNTGNLDSITVTPSDDPLVICVDKENESMISQVTEMWEAVNPCVLTKLIVIPQDSEKAETVIDDLRIQIMSGEGPDCFFLRTAHPNYEKYPVMFNDPEKTMNSDIFLCLDEYLQRAGNIDMSKYNNTVMSAGRNSEGQYILPYTYEYLFLIYDFNDDSSQEENPYVKASLMENHSCRLFGQIIDYENNELLLSADDIISTAEHFEEITDDLFNLTNGKMLNPLLDYVGISTNRWTELSTPSKPAYKRDFTFFPITNTDGGITAGITSYAAISKYTKQPENAFSFIDFLYSDTVLKGSNELSELEGYNLAINYIFTMGISVDNDTFKDSIKVLNEADKEEVFQLSEQINYAHFYTEEDRTINEYLTKILSTDDDSKRREIAEQLYDDLWMQVSE